jgi:CDP-diacylglycerol pyrophosphatase
MNKKHSKLLFMSFTSVMLLVIGVGVASAQNELWEQVNTCIQNAITNGFMPNPSPIPPPTPCVYVEPEGLYANLGDGFAILKAKDSHIYHFLTIPTKAITGIEDPQVNFFVNLSAVNTSYSPNYWTPAWFWINKTVVLIYKAQKNKILGPDQLGLSINSPQARSQNQLHIHMACIDKTVQNVLAGVKPPISTCTTAPCEWSEPIPVPGHFSYRAVVLADLFSLNPFMVMKSIPHFDPTRATLVVTGKPGTGQYYLLEDYSHGSDPGYGEGLLDTDCATQ